MLKSSAPSAIRLRGVRHNNLKNFDLDLPLNQLIVITGLSGSGKSSLAFDTLFAEGQRRYIETFSPYARQFFDRMDKPQVDSIEGIPPAIAIEQRNAVRTTRSTVGTMTEICDYMKTLWPHIAELHCRQCGRPVRKDSPQAIWAALQEVTDGQEVLVTFELPLTEKLALEECLALVAKQGYQRVLLGNEVVRLEDVLNRVGANALPSLTVVQDRLRLEPQARARFVEACEQAYHFGKGQLAIQQLGLTQHATRNTRRFSNRLHCAECDLEYREPSPALFSFNHPVGACPACRGFGRIISIDYDRVMPERRRTLAQGVVKPWLSGMSAECQDDLMRTCRRFSIPTDVPFEKLPKKWQDFVIEGEPGYGKDAQHQWPRAWYGVRGYFRWLESKSYKMHVRVLLSRYRAYTPCPDCRGRRFQPEALLFRVRLPPRTPSEGVRAGKGGENGSGNGSTEFLTLADFYQLPLRDALVFIEAVAARSRLKNNEPLAIALHEVRSRLEFLNDVGLGYLTLERPTRSLSGGETERVNLTTCLGTRLVNTLFVLDEPSVGLHPRDTDRLVRLLLQLRSAGNTVVVVEHEASVMRAADQLVDLGPGHGATGGEVVFQGTFAALLRSGRSLTGQYLSGRRRIELPVRRPVGLTTGPRHAAGVRYPQGRGEALVLNEALKPVGDRRDACPALRLAQATRHNLRDLTVEIPLSRFVAVTGVSGSGKTTLVREVLLPALTEKLQPGQPEVKASERVNSDQEGDDTSDPRTSAPRSVVLEGAENLARVVLVDQSLLGKTPRSNPAVYIGAFDDIREVFAQSETAKQRGLNASAFSFNSSQGQCERCRGAGFEKIEMQFLSDVFIRCPDCQGRRYRQHILQIKLSPAGADVRKRVRQNLRDQPAVSPLHLGTHKAWSVADVLEATVEEAIAFLGSFPESRPAGRAVASLKLLGEVGLGYLKLGQPINTLSGGESQRLKLVRHLAEAVEETGHASPRVGDAAAQPPKPTLFLFDEPTTGLHFEDVRVLLRVFQRLVDTGHSVLVIEHNLDVIKSADWVIDLGPEAGDQGGMLVAQGPPEALVSCPQSHTGRSLQPLLSDSMRSGALRRKDARKVAACVR